MRNRLLDGNRRFGNTRRFDDGWCFARHICRGSRERAGDWTLDDNLCGARGERVGCDARNRLLDDSRCFGDDWRFGNTRCFGDDWRFGNTRCFNDTRRFNDMRSFYDTRCFNNTRSIGNARRIDSGRRFARCISRGNRA